MWFQERLHTQYSLITLIEKKSQNLDKDGSCGALLTDLSKAFDCIVYDFLIAKLEACGSTYQAVNFMKNYPLDRTQNKNE